MKSIVFHVIKKMGAHQSQEICRNDLFIHLDYLGDFSLAIISGVIYVHSISAGGQSQLLNRNYILLIICDTFAILAPKYSRGYFILQKPADDYVTDDYGLYSYAMNDHCWQNFTIFQSSCQCLYISRDGNISLF